MCRASTLLAELEDDDELPEPDEETDDNEDDNKDEEEYDDVMVNKRFLGWLKNCLQLCHFSHLLRQSESVIFYPKFYLTQKHELRTRIYHM